MAKKKNVAVDEGMNTDGNRAINKFRISDAVMMLILVILCATCVLPFIHLLAKSISGNAYVIANRWHSGQKELTLMLIRPFLKMVAWYTV